MRALKKAAVNLINIKYSKPKKKFVSSNFKFTFEFPFFHRSSSNETKEPSFPQNKVCWCLNRD